MSGKLTVLQNVGLSGVSPNRATLTISQSGPQGPPGSGVAGDPVDAWLAAHAGSIGLFTDEVTTVDKLELVGAGLETTPDLQAGFLRDSTDTVLRRYSPMGTMEPDQFVVAVTDVTGSDSWLNPQIVPVDGVPSSTFDWLSGGPVYQCEPGIGLMILHVEVNDPEDPVNGWKYHTLHGAKVVDDDGTVSITYLGPLIRHEAEVSDAIAGPFQMQGAGGAYLIWQESVYIFHADYVADGSYKATVSRCPVADVVAAVTDDAAPEFYKWSGESLDDEWTSPALGGSTVSSQTLDRWGIYHQMDFLSMPDGRLLAVGIEQNAFLVTSVAADPLSWEPHALIDTRSDAGEWVYATARSDDVASPKTITGEYIYVDYLYADGEPSRWQGEYRVEQRRLRPAVAARQFPSQSAVTALVTDNFEVPSTQQGFMVATPGVEITLPPIDPSVSAVQIVAPSALGHLPVVVTANTDLPINNIGDVTINPDELWLFVPLIQGNVWTAFQQGPDDLIPTTVDEPHGFPTRATSTLSFNNATRTFTITPVGNSFDVWCAGRRYVKTSAESRTIPSGTGLYYIFYENGLLLHGTSYFDWPTEAPVAYIYWNSATQTAQFFADERHGVTMDWATHEYLHRTRGAALASGFALSSYTTTGSGNADSDAQVGLANGTFFDEDLQVDIVHDATPTANTWEQRLSTVLYAPVFYRSGTGWTRDTATAYPLKQGSNRVAYNLNTGGTWSTPDLGNSKYGVSWVVATNNLSEPVIVILGQAEYASEQAAQGALWSELDLTGLPVFEMRPLWKLVFQTANAYTNTVKARLRVAQDLRSDLPVGPANSTGDHGSLSGLDDDDHFHYHTDTRGDLRYDRRGQDSAATGLYAFSDFNEFDDGSIHDQLSTGSAVGDPVTWIDGRTVGGAGVDSFLEVGEIVSGVLRHRGTRLSLAVAFPLPGGAVGGTPAHGTAHTATAGWVDATAGPGTDGPAFVRMGFLDGDNSNGYVGYIKAATTVANHQAIIARDDSGTPTQIAGPWDLGRRLEPGDRWSFTHDGNTFAILVNDAEVGRVTETTYPAATFNVTTVILSSEDAINAPVGASLPGMGWHALSTGSVLRHGTVIGPSSSVDNRVALWDGTSGTLLKQSSAVLAAIATSGSASDLATGTVPTARLGSGTASASTYLRGDGSWQTVAGSSGGGPFPVATNDFFLISSQRGATGYSPASPSTTATNSNNTAIFVPFLVDKTIGVDQLQCHCVTPNAGASAVVRLGIYSNTSGRPGTVLADGGTQSINAAGIKTGSFTAVTLSAGWYWAVIVAQGLDTAGTNPTFSHATNVLALAPETTPQASNTLYPRFQATISGAFGNSPSVTIARAITANCPHIWIRISTP